MKIKNSIISSFHFLAVFFFIITLSISLPICIRPFYYMHIDAYRLDETSGFEKHEIMEAYDDILDYLTIPGKSFSAGVMKFSEDGAAHFRDCKKLFMLNFSVLLISSIYLFLSFILSKRYKIALSAHSPGFWASVCAVGFPVALGFLISLDPYYAFEIFHKIFFPGKTNWIFSPSRDEIIKVLPEQFFFNCAILIGSSILLLSLTFIFSGNKRKEHKNK